jgi:hypothetical protein
MRQLITIAAAASAALPGQARAAAVPEGPQPYFADRANREQALECLTQAVYYEARNQSADGQRAVAQVVLNRTRHPNYPGSVCGVVFQGSERRTGCQFSFTCDGSMNATIEPGAWERAERIAAAALSGSVYRPVGLALNYHTTAILPYWAPSLVQQAVIGAHIFYRPPGSTDSFSQATARAEPEVYLPPIRFAPRSSGRSLQRSNRLADLEIPVEEIAVVELPLRFRSVGPRARVAAAPSRSATPRRAVMRSGPRVAFESGVRVARGS